MGNVGTPETAVRHKYAELAPSYDRAEAVFERVILAGMRRRLVGRVRGRVLEIAAGTGANFPYYPAGVRLTAVDLSDAMLEEARRSGKSERRETDLGVIDAQRLAFRDGAFDTVVCTLALCTIPEPVAAVSEMVRVCRPGGRLLFLEHVKSPVGMVGWVQDRLADWHFRRSCCRWNQDTRGILASAGLATSLLEERFVGVFLLLEGRPAV